MSVRRVEPGPGQESVWDYPRPPRAERFHGRVQVVVQGVTIADSTEAVRVLETSHPPVYYIPPGDVRGECISDAPGSSFCEWKGVARYHTVRVGDRVIERAAWSYPEPTPPFRMLKDFLAFYPGMMDECYVDGELVRAQVGGFYGGWITSNIVGPYKGEPGTRHW